MRPKKDPKIRREVFVTAAAQLFAERGYEGVSIRDVLDAVGNKSSSPSVFYYYFKSKEELYRCVVESIARAYIESFDEDFTQIGSLEERASAMLTNIVHGLMTSGNLLAETNSIPNRLFMLDMREQVTLAMARKWESFLTDEGLATPENAPNLALFITGGIGQLLFAQLEQGTPTDEQVHQIMTSIASFTLATLGIALDIPIAHAIESEANKE